MKNADGKRVSLRQRIRQAYDRTTCRFCRAELSGCRELTLQGCREILEYGHERIVLSVSDPDAAKITVCGEGLLCLSYHTDAVQIKGNIRQIVLDDILSVE